jgi:hypothetical protein
MFVNILYVEYIDVALNAVAYVLTFVVIISFLYAVCTCYELSVELVLFYIGRTGCMCCYLVFNSCSVSDIGLYSHILIYVCFMCSLFLLILCI